MSELLKIFEKCQNLLDEKLSFLKETIEYMQKYDIGMDSQSM